MAAHLDDVPPCFPCPTDGCEGGKWMAFYMVPQSRGVDLYLIDGKPEEGDADDARTTYDEDPGATDFFECEHCGGRIALDGSIDEPGAIEAAEAWRDTIGEIAL